MKKQLSKGRSIRLHRRMWNWIADQHEKCKTTSVYKTDYFVAMGISKDEIPRSNCYCCEYGKQRVERDKEFLKNLNECSYCPFDWGSDNYRFMCMDHSNKNCEPSLYELYCSTMDLDTDNYEEMARLAREIANLPRKRKERD